MSDAETYYEKGVEALELAEGQPAYSPQREARLLEARTYFDAANTCLRFKWSRPPAFTVEPVDPDRPQYEGTVPRD